MPKIQTYRGKRFRNIGNFTSFYNFTFVNMWISMNPAFCQSIEGTEEPMV